MATINIGGDPHDPCYRYKMPVPHCTKEGKAQNTKVVIDNILEISAALNRDPEWIAKYLTLRLNCPVKLDKHRLLIRSEITQVHLMVEFQNFIKTYVVCPTCNLPELKIKKKTKGLVYSVCDACGSKHKIEKVGTTEEKMYKFIQSHLDHE